MTKADEIRAIVAEHSSLTTTEIADIVGCLPEYVRVCARQRVEGASDIDRRYREKFHAKHGLTPFAHRYRTDPDFRKQSLAKAYRSHKKRMADPDYREREKQRKKRWRDRKRDAA